MSTTTTHPHWRDVPAVRALVEPRMAVDPARAIHIAIGRGCRVDRADVATPTLDALAELPRELQAEYTLRNAGRVTMERRALRLVETQDNLLRDRDAAEAAAKTDTREKKIAARALDLEAAHWNALRTAWREQATREVDGEPASPAPAAPATTKRRSSAQ